MELEGRETSERRVPSTLEEVYELRDASATPEERDYYQERIYRLIGEEYRSRGVRFEESARQRERSRAEALQAGDQDTRPPGGNWYSGGGSENSEKRSLRASFRGTGVSGGGGKALPPGFDGYGG